MHSYRFSKNHHTMTKQEKCNDCNRQSLLIFFGVCQCFIIYCDKDMNRLCLCYTKTFNFMHRFSIACHEHDYGTRQLHVPIHIHVVFLRFFFKISENVIFNAKVLIVRCSVNVLRICPISFINHNIECSTFDM